MFGAYGSQRCRIYYTQKKSWFYLHLNKNKLQLWRIHLLYLIKIWILDLQMSSNPIEQKSFGSSKSTLTSKLIIVSNN